MLKEEAPTNEEEIFTDKDGMYSLPYLFHDRFEDIEVILSKLKKVTGKKFNSKFSVYGNIHMPWNSGRVNSVRIDIDIDNVNEVREYTEFMSTISRLGLDCGYTFTAEDVDVNNSLGNFMLENAELFSDKNDHYAILQDDNLLHHIRKKYPRIKVKSSMLKPTYESNNRDSSYYNDLLNRYDIVVLHSDDNYNLELLSGINDLGRIEILVNEKCPMDCETRKIHYTKIHDLFDAESSAEVVKCNTGLENVMSTSCSKIKNGSNNIPSSISFNHMDTLKKMGVRHWKIQGRGMISPTSEVIAYVFKNEVIKRLMER